MCIRDSSEATCGDEGEEYRECSKCYYTEYRDIPATGNHVWGNWLVIQPADCFKSGERVRYCKNCSEEQSESIPAYGHHTWTNWHIDNDANCLNSGKKSRYCTCLLYTSILSFALTSFFRKVPCLVHRFF